MVIFLRQFGFAQFLLSIEPPPSELSFVQAVNNKLGSDLIETSAEGLDAHFILRKFQPMPKTVGKFHVMTERNFI